VLVMRRKGRVLWVYEEEEEEEQVKNEEGK
jgi:hypothetical protein